MSNKKQKSCKYCRNYSIRCKYCNYFKRYLSDTDDANYCNKYREISKSKKKQIKNRSRIKIFYGFRG